MKLPCAQGLFEHREKMRCKPTSRRTKQKPILRVFHIRPSLNPSHITHNGSCDGTNARCGAWWKTWRSTPCPRSRRTSSRQVRPVRNSLGRTLGSPSRILVERLSISRLWRFSRCDCHYSRTRNRGRGLNARLSDAEARAGGCTHGSHGSYARRIRR